MRVLFVMALLTALIFPADTFAEIQTFTATHTYVLGDHDSKDDARQRCLLETKRKILEQAGVYIESASEVKNFDLTKDKITSFAAAVMQINDTKEEVGFQQGHMTLTLTITAQANLTEVRKQLAGRQMDAGMHERLKRLEAQLEAIQQHMQQASGRAPTSPPIDISVEDLQTLRTQAAQGDPTAQSNLGKMYALGQGVPQDYAMARQWFEKAALQGYAMAQTGLGILYEKGRGIPQNFATARQWYEKAALQGYSMAQYNLGWLYHYGRGIPQDYKLARQWFEKAAIQDNERAQTALGLLYANGLGVPQDYATAREWYEKAAAQGDAWAQYNLGQLHYTGQGVSLDYVRAYMWFNLAATHLPSDQQKSAIDSQDRVSRSMTPTQIAEAQQLAREWKPKR